MYSCYAVARSIGAIALAMAVAATNIGCSKNSTATQVVAKVNGEEISIHQVNGALSKIAGVTQENLPDAKREILERLIEQQILINEAISKKLDRSPEVVAAIENAKREIIARSTLDLIASAQPKSTEEEAMRYFSEHPELFSQRRLFNLQEIALRKPVKDIAEISGRVATTKTIEELSTWLKDRNIEFAANTGTRAAEQIPLEVLPKLHQFRDGQLALIEGNDAFFIMRIVASRLAPIDETVALPRIKMFLFNQRGVVAINREKTALKERANVQYLGEFTGGEIAYKAKVEAEVKAASDMAAQASAAADALAKIKADEKAALMAQADAQSKARAESRVQLAKDQKPAGPSTNVNLEKGIKGLQ